MRICPILTHGKKSLHGASVEVWATSQGPSRAVAARIYLA